MVYRVASKTINFRLSPEVMRMTKLVEQVEAEQKRLEAQMAKLLELASLKPVGRKI